MALPHLICSVDECSRGHYARGLCKGHYQRLRSTGSIGVADFRPIGQEFWSRVDRSGDCWVWVGANVQGYGVLVIGRRRYRAHRYAYELAYGAIPQGLAVCHKCDNPPCCNPAHLFLGTHADNMADMVRKGRQGRPSAKLRPDDIPLIRSDARRYGEIALDFGVSPSLIGQIKRGAIWRGVA